MRVDIVTIFPELFAPFLRVGVLGRAVTAGLIEVAVHDLRDWSDNSHRSVDDEPYGGGGGMVMTAPPWISAVRELARGGAPWRVMLSPQGRRLDAGKVLDLARRPHLMLLCSRYEGVDERVLETVVDEEISIGDYVLSGGETASMVVLEAVSREIPGVVGRQESVERDSFRNGLLDFPHYTRPRVVEGLEVPEVLRSGHHAEIERWRQRQALRATREKRPDLLAGGSVSESSAACVAPEEEG